MSKRLSLFLAAGCLGISRLFQRAYDAIIAQIDAEDCPPQDPEKKVEPFKWAYEGQEECAKRWRALVAEWRKEGSLPGKGNPPGEKPKKPSRSKSVPPESMAEPTSEPKDIEADEPPPPF